MSSPEHKSVIHVTVIAINDIKDLLDLTIQRLYSHYDQEIIDLGCKADLLVLVQELLAILQYSDDLILADYPLLVQQWQRVIYDTYQCRGIVVNLAIVNNQLNVFSEGIVHVKL